MTWWEVEKSVSLTRYYWGIFLMWSIWVEMLCSVSVLSLERLIFVMCKQTWNWLRQVVRTLLCVCCEKHFYRKQKLIRCECDITFNCTICFVQTSASECSILCSSWSQQVRWFPFMGDHSRIQNAIRWVLTSQMECILLPARGDNAAWNCRIAYALCS
jgi:hypothetical protein